MASNNIVLFVVFAHSEMQGEIVLPLQAVPVSIIELKRSEEPQILEGGLQT